MPQAEAQAQNTQGASSGMARGSAPLDIIDFEAQTPGEIVGSVFSNMGNGPVVITGINPTQIPNNVALIFDSANPTGEDPDLGTPNETFGGPGIGLDGEMGMTFQNGQPLGNLLIVAEDLVDANGDGLIDDSDDSDRVGSELRFDFSAVAPVFVRGMNVIDVEPKEQPPLVAFFDAGGGLIASQVLVQPRRQRRVARANFNVSGVFEMRVLLNGSGGLDSITFRPQDDCNGNGVPDEEDIANGTNQDCDG